LEPTGVASGNLPANIFVVRSKLPKGKVVVLQQNLPESERAAAAAAVTEAVAFMPANSPTFAAAWNLRANENQGIALVPLAKTDGGTVAGNSMVFGTETSVRVDGTKIYPAYTLAHELGHENQRHSAANSPWNLPKEAFEANADGSPSDARKIAPNSSEYYAYQFAEQVAKEIREKTGLDIGQQKSHGDRGPATEKLGILPPRP